MHTESTSHVTETSPLTSGQQPIPGAAFQLKKCRTCGEEKPLRAFYLQRKCAQPYRLDCIACVAEKARRRRVCRKTEPPKQTRRCQKCRRTQPIAEYAKDARCRAGHALTCLTCMEHTKLRREQRRRDLNLPDGLLQESRELREQRVDLGIAIAHATCPPGHCRSIEEIAAYSGLTEEAVRRIEIRALWKMRARAKRILAALDLEDLVQEGVPQ